MSREDKAAWQRIRIPDKGDLAHEITALVSHANREEPSYGFRERLERLRISDLRDLLTALDNAGAGGGNA